MSAQKQDQKIGDKPVSAQEDQDIDFYWTIAAGSVAGGIIATVLADEIRNGKLMLSVLLIVAILLISGYTGKRRIIRLVVSGVVGAIMLTLQLIGPILFALYK